jgi:hypothetical protein
MNKTLETIRNHDVENKIEITERFLYPNPKEPDGLSHSFWRAQPHKNSRFANLNPLR